MSNAVHANSDDDKNGTQPRPEFTFLLGIMCRCNAKFFLAPKITVKHIASLPPGIHTTGREVMVLSSIDCRRGVSLSCCN